MNHLKILGIKLPYDPAVPLLGIYSEETKTEKDTCTQVFTAALFTIVRTWKQPRCPLADEWIKKMWYKYIYIHIHTYISHIHIHSGILPRAYYTEWSKSEIEQQIWYINVHTYIYMKSRKMVLMNLFAGQE